MNDLDEAKKTINTLNLACEDYRLRTVKAEEELLKLRKLMGLGPVFFSDPKREIIIYATINGRIGSSYISVSLDEQDFFFTRDPRRHIMYQCERAIDQLAYEYIKNNSKEKL